MACQGTLPSSSLDVQNTMGEKAHRGMGAHAGIAVVLSRHLQVVIVLGVTFFFFHFASARGSQLKARGSTRDDDDEPMLQVQSAHRRSRVTCQPPSFRPEPLTRMREAAFTRHLYLTGARGTQPLPLPTGMPLRAAEKGGRGGWRGGCTVNTPRIARRESMPHAHVLKTSRGAGGDV